MEPSIPIYMHYWGKAKRDPTQEGEDYHLLPYHCLDVAAVAWCYLNERSNLLKDLSEFLEIEANQLRKLLVFIFALHDLGKFASAFQNLYEANDGYLVKSDAYIYDGRKYRHDRMGLYFWQHISKNLLSDQLASDLEDREYDYAKDALDILMECSLGHHGQPVNGQSTHSIKKFTVDQDLEAANSFFIEVVKLLKPELPLEKMQCKQWQQNLKLVSWQIAGLAVISDWVGSDSSHFTYHDRPMALSEYWQKALKTAEIALKATDLIDKINVQSFRSIKEYYGYEPTPLQHWAESVPVDDSPQLFILEDITGAGKTEAALALTHRLMEAGAAEGFYLGLPTMATSNAMFSRVASHYLKMLGNAEKTPSIVLAHSARDMNDEFREAVLNVENPDSYYNPEDQTATAQCNQWLADSRKKALLAPVGVGTIDQALLAVLPRRHQSLRLLGLNRKVLVFDEIHAADEYMFELLESLLALHLHQGGSAILLTATLSKKQRQRLTKVWQEAGGLVPEPLTNDAFPLATKVSLNQHPSLAETPLESRADVCRSVAVNFIHSFAGCVNQILKAVERGECVVWIRNSVDDALDAYREISSKINKPEDCLLFHSRFIVNDRKRIESKVLELFGKDSNAQTRAGKVLIATQVFQESLDADADVMISDICPIDDLIQRTGRLHRHTRNEQRRYQNGIKDSRQPLELWLHCPEWDETPKSDWLSKDFRNTEFVYRSPGRLWLAIRKLRELGALRMPQEARQLIEAVYSDDACSEIPESLLNQENTLISEERMKANAAKSVVLDWQRHGYCAKSAIGWTEDLTDISTRFSDIETVEVLLLKTTGDGEVIPWVGMQDHAIQLSTVKLSKHKYADKLAQVPEHYMAAVDAFRQQNRAAKYLQCWLPEFDASFGYSTAMGIIDLARM